MSAAARVKQVQQHIARPTNTGTFEDMPLVRHMTDCNSAGPRVPHKICIITGCNSPLGIGRATAHQLAANGARALYLCDFASSHLAAHERELRSLYPNTEVHTRVFDAADEESVKGVVEEAVGTYGRLDVMFANAATGGAKLFTEVEGGEFMRVMRVNVLSVFLAVKYAAKAMLKNSPHPSGSIIATASVAGLRSNAGDTPYSASKAAVISLMQTTCYQLAGTSIRCNALCPGIIETGMTKQMYDSARERGTESKIGQLCPMKRGGVPDEIARVALFLASDDASYVNGQAWAVCGGLSAGHPFVPGKLA